MLPGICILYNSDWKQVYPLSYHTGCIWPSCRANGTKQLEKQNESKYLTIHTVWTEFLLFTRVQLNNTYP